MAIFTVPARPTFLGLCAMITGTESTVESSLGLPSAYERSLGDSEVSYYLPARADGVNDIYVHLGLRAPVSIMTPSIVSVAYAILRLRHPLISSRIRMNSYSDIRFLFSYPASAEEAIEDASRSIEFCSVPKEELLGSFLNGRRILSDDCLCYFIISSKSQQASQCQPKAAAPSDYSDDRADFDLLTDAAHCIGDGLCLHRLANDLFTLISLPFPTLMSTLQTEFFSRSSRPIPPSLESYLPTPCSGLHAVSSRVAFALTQRKLIGGQSFALTAQATAPRNVRTETVSYSIEETKQILRACKANGVSISNALFAVCNFAWIASGNVQQPELPTMFYSAVSLRHLQAPTPVETQPPPSYVSSSVGYFNVILPSFLPSHSPASSPSSSNASSPSPSPPPTIATNLTSTFWERSLQSRFQSLRQIRSPLFAGRAREMSRERADKARRWAKEDDSLPINALLPPLLSQPLPPSQYPSEALLGLSSLGNVDPLYNHSSFRSISIVSTTCGVKLRKGGMLLVFYTFLGRLWTFYAWNDAREDES